MVRTVQVTFDATDPHELAQWWAELLGYVVEDFHDAVSGLLADGVVGEADVLRRQDRLAFADGAAARVPEAKLAKNRVHLDIPIEGDDLEAEVARVRTAGATLMGFDRQPGHRWAVMRDPEGNEFCLH
jgi:predicted enzyme related to lactoylglutathione lyase